MWRCMLCLTVIPSAAALYLLYTIKRDFTPVYESMFGEKERESHCWNCEFGFFVASGSRAHFCRRWVWCSSTSPSCSVIVPCYHPFSWQHINVNERERHQFVVNRQSKEWKVLVCIEKERRHEKPAPAPGGGSGILFTSLEWWKKGKPAHPMGLLLTVILVEEERNMSKEVRTVLWVKMGVFRSFYSVI